jgi:hypothetical protein
MPVHTFFEGDSARIEVEIEVRVMAEKPDDAPDITQEQLDAIPEAEQAKLLADVLDYLAKAVDFEFVATGVFEPTFSAEFVGTQVDREKKMTDIMIVKATAEVKPPTAATGYRITSTLAAPPVIIFLNSVDGEQVPRVEPLFVGEQSFTLNFRDPPRAAARQRPKVQPPPIGDREPEPGTGLEPELEPAPPIRIPRSEMTQPSEQDSLLPNVLDFLHQGFVHVVPRGLDHVLFVLGLFLMTRRWKPLFFQVTTFTVAHSITLALATFGVGFFLSGRTIEVIIALSLVAVAAENIWLRDYDQRRRLPLIFVFGLIHGLGFAGALSDLNLPPASLPSCLLGFNIGVELGQIAVVLVAALLCMKITSDETFRQKVTLPGSVAIGLAGLYFAVARLMA